MHTKGPWTIHEDKGHRFANGEVDYGGFRIDAKDVEQLAYVWRSNRRFGSLEPFGAAEAEANARLIAAAPDLLAVCQRALSHPVACHCGEPDCATTQMRAAVAKAIGR